MPCSDLQDDQTMLRSLRLVAALLIAMLALIGACTAPARPARALAPALQINEFMPRPGTGGEWAELINLGDTDLDLAGWAIDDDTIGGTRTLIAAGTSAPAHGLLLVALTANILNDTGTDAIQLSDPAGTLVDSFAYSSASAGQSYARMPDGGTSWLKGAPSPGAWNSSANSTMPVTPSSAPPATNTPSPTATTSPTYTPTATNTATASATATPYLPGILLNEFVAYPKTLYTTNGSSSTTAWRYTGRSVGLEDRRQRGRPVAICSAARQSTRGRRRLPGGRAAQCDSQ